jgi:hypothetical protein
VLFFDFAAVFVFVLDERAVFAACFVLFVLFAGFVAARFALPLFDFARFEVPPFGVAAARFELPLFGFPARVGGGELGILSRAVLAVEGAMA